MTGINHPGTFHGLPLHMDQAHYWDPEDDESRHVAVDE